MKTFISYKIDNQVYDVVIERKNNKNTYIKIKDDLTILVTTNLFASKRDIVHMLDREYDYLAQTIKKVQRRKKKEDEFYYLGRKYDIIMVGFDDIEISDNKIFCSSESKLNKWLKERMSLIFKERLKVCYDMFDEDIPFPILKIRSMKTRWGVCNKRDNSVTLNSKLIRYDIHEIDYVIIHELSHFVHFDHSKAFWETVGTYMPDYKRAVKILKE